MSPYRYLQNPDHRQLDLLDRLVHVTAKLIEWLTAPAGHDIRAPR